MEKSENNILKDKQSKWKFFNRIPKVFKYIIILIVIAVFFYLGVMFKTSFTTQTKTTKLGLEDVGELVTQTCYVTVVEDTEVNRKLLIYLIFHLQKVDKYLVMM